MNKNIFRLISDISHGEEEKRLEIVDDVYFPQIIANEIIRGLKLKDLSCEYCGEELNPENLRAIVHKKGKYIAVCKKLSCNWKYIWDKA